MTYYKPGDHSVICDRTGMKVKASQTRKEWTGLIVRKESWEPRHPQEFIRGRPDRQAVQDPRPEGTDLFVTPGQVTADNLTVTGVPDPGEAGHTNWDNELEPTRWDYGVSGVNLTLWD